jgi:hypothetical protein
VYVIRKPGRPCQVELLLGTHHLPVDLQAAVRRVFVDRRDAWPW